MNHPQTWKVTPAQYAAMETELDAAGLAISGEAGTVEKKGVTASWTYDGVTLSITVLSAPPFFTATAEKEIASAVTQALSKLNAAT